ncbi:MAG: hypothetical protein K2V38_17275, partial [Gemmataceae bacterium]|nr:hypothetical protein [Gemmataceae bacterium]
EMMVQNRLIADGALSKADIRLPIRGAATSLAGLAVALVVCLAGLWQRGGAVRLLGLLALVAVMVQGLFGGVRVLLNELIGPDLATIHGIFAQVVFGLLTTVAVMTARPVEVSSTQERLFGKIGAGLAALVFVQIVFGALVRHGPTPLTQRLHMFTAFVVALVTMEFVHRLFKNPAVRARVAPLGWVLALLLVAQVYLGVEAWLARFGSPELSESQRMTPLYIATRTLHALIGSSLWATSLAAALWLLRPSVRAVDTLQDHAPEQAALAFAPATGGPVGVIIHADALSK